MAGSVFSIKNIIILSFLVLATLLVSVPAFPATYAVDPSGNDGNAGTESAPWRTVQHAADNVSAGDTVIVNAGTYNESVLVTRSGAADAPIVFAAQPGSVLVSPDPSASLEAFNVASGVGYVTLTNIEATGGFDETIFLRDGAHDIVVDGCNLHHNQVGVLLGSVSQVTVSGCLLHDNSGPGLRAAGTTDHVVVRDTDSFRNGDPAVCSAAVDGFTTSTDADGISFVRTRAFDNGGDGYDLKGNETVLSDVESTGNACTGMKLWQSASVQGCLVAGNARGFGVGSLLGGSTVAISNCTVADNAGVGLDLTSPLTSGTTYSVDVADSIVTGDFKAVQYTSAVNLREDHNILYRSSAYDVLIDPVGRRGYNGHDVNIGRWKAHRGRGEGTLAVDPLFVDPGAGDYQVQADSAAVARGTDPATATVPAGVSPNIGLYQEPTGPTNHRPWADAGRDRWGRVGRIVRFSAAGSLDPDGDPLDYTWDFGDGTSPASGFKTTHRYFAVGTYVAALSVSDGSLSATTGVQVTIR